MVNTDSPTAAAVPDGEQKPANIVPWYAAAVAVLVLATAAGIMTYSRLPDRIPVSWGQNGKVELWAGTTVLTAFSTHAGAAVGIAVVAVLSAAVPRLLARAFRSVTPDALMLKTWAARVLRLALAKTSLAVSAGAAIQIAQIWYFPAVHPTLFTTVMAGATVFVIFAIAIPPGFSFACLLDAGTAQTRAYRSVRKYLGPAW